MHRVKAIWHILGKIEICLNIMKVNAAEDKAIHDSWYSLCLKYLLKWLKTFFPAKCHMLMVVVEAAKYKIAPVFQYYNHLQNSQKFLYINRRNLPCHFSYHAYFSWNMSSWRNTCGVLGKPEILDTLHFL